MARTTKTSPAKTGMGSRGYEVLGWVVFQLASRLARRKASDNRRKLGAIAVIAVVLVGGVIAAKVDSDA
jgi:hypothetical protein